MFINLLMVLRSSGLLKKDNVWLLNASSTVSDCEPMKQGGGALFFYTRLATSASDAPFARAAVISSRQLVIGPLDPANVTLEPHPPAITTTPPSNDGNKIIIVIITTIYKYYHFYRNYAHDTRSECSRK